ncbi:MAG: hypothetical protein KJ623_02905 [Nanoarchaeota archaeon]|nr:hypothetical protein [Nanoarchaeota archaeon]MBU0963243.1 hypothetical protein [Nanoarchaeota archaeon]
MDFLDLDISLKLKNYADKREQGMKYYQRLKERKYGFYAFESFEKPEIREAIYQEFSKFPVREENGLFVISVKSNHSTIILSADTEEELRKNFIRFLLSY